MSYLVSGPWIDPGEQAIEAGTRTPETDRFPRSADLPQWDTTRPHLGLLVGIVGPCWRGSSRGGPRPASASELVGRNPFAALLRRACRLPATCLAALAFSGGLA
ncbi:MAG: hypothetical protein WKF58_11780 [Ilumatobacteraceae bacterium]